MTRLAALAAIATILAACGGEQAGQGSAAEPAPETAAAEDLPRGGTLRVATADPNFDFRQTYISADGEADYTLDPQKAFDNTSWELFRCCLLRTLMSFNGQPTSQGGAEPRPDLADGTPEVARDGLTWTFNLRRGQRYAPPYGEQEIVAADFVRALERVFTPTHPSFSELGTTLGSYSDYYEVIEGTTAFKNGEADSISGLETPDDHTLVVHLTQPSGDLGILFALAATAPIPAGAADGHDEGYGPFLAASGPYMLEEYVQRESIFLIRNPSWNPADDDLREAYVDRIEIAFLDSNAAFRRLEAGELDLVFDVSPGREVIDQFRGDPELQANVVSFPADALGFIALNIAQPPFDDVHVRKAVNLAVDKQVLRQAAADSFPDFVMRRATHVAPDFLENNLLLEYEPYSTPEDRGDLEAARAEIAQSTYDADGDGRCDGPACSGIRAIVENAPPWRDAAANVRSRLAELGLELDFVEADDFFEELGRVPEQRTGVVLPLGWTRDYPGGGSWFPALFESSSIAPSCCNNSLVGASPEQLRTWGYETTSVASVDAEIAECQTQVGGAAFQCWAELDQLLMETIVAIVPFALSDTVRAASSRVASLVIDQAFLNPALDRIALSPAGS